MASLTAINPLYQHDLEAAYRAVRKYHDIVNVEGHSERKAERAFDSFRDKLESLPKREQAVLQAFHKAEHGYEA